MPATHHYDQATNTATVTTDSLTEEIMFYAGEMIKFEPLQLDSLLDAPIMIEYGSSDRKGVVNCVFNGIPGRCEIIMLTPGLNLWRDKEIKSFSFHLKLF